MLCPACAFDNAEGHRFCGQCGSPLNAAETAPAWLPAGERRQVTILFADLAGFTRLTRTLDAEEVHRLLNLFFDAADDAVRVHGGHIDKHIGDNVMALFGAPVAHTDDPARAVRTAFQIHQAVNVIETGNHEKLAAHIGIATGEVVASTTGSAAHQEYTVVGEAVNLASRLEAAAGAGETLVSDSVARSTRDIARFEEAGSVQAKGFDHDMAAWRLVDAAPEAAPNRPPMAGRHAELAVFDLALDQLRESRTGTAICLRGEPGIGKTRLLDAYEERALEAGMACCTALVLDFGGGKEQDALAVLTRDLLGLLGMNELSHETLVEQEVLESGQDAFVAVLLGSTPTEAQRSRLAALGPKERRDGTVDVFCRLAQAASKVTPLLLRIEDLHWADETILEVVKAIAAAAQHCNLALVVSTRIEGDPFTSQIYDSCHLHARSLAPLEPNDANALAARYSGLGADRIRACLERAEGHPLFLDQLLRNASESNSDALPGSLQSVVAARMDMLPQSDRRALQVASVLGQRFELGALSFLLDQDYDAALLLENGLVRPSGPMLLFAHALVREGVLSSLLRTDRRLLHGRAAEWFSTRDLAAHAEHLEKADDPAAADAYVRAGRDAAGHYRYDEALIFARRAHALNERMVTALCLEGDMLREIGAIEQSHEIFDQAGALASTADETFACAMGLAACRRMTDDFQGALDALDGAEQASGSLDAKLAEVYYQRGNINFPLGRIDDCLSAHQAALVHARNANLPNLEARAHGGLGDAWYMRGHMETAYRSFGRCVDLAIELGDDWLRASYLSMRGNARFYSTNLDEAWQDTQDTIDLAMNIGHRRAEIVARLAGFILYDMNRMAHAREILTIGLERSREIGSVRFEGWCLMFLSKVAWQTAEHDEARHLARLALEIGRGVGRGHMGAMAFGASALCAESDDVALALLEEGEVFLEAGTISHNHLHFHRDAMDTALRRGIPDLALHHAEALERFTSQQPMPWCDFFIQRTRDLASLPDNAEPRSRELLCSTLALKARTAGLELAAIELEAMNG